MLLTIAEILDATKGTLIKGNKNLLVKNICIDSRKISRGDLFIAIKGKSLDGHNFISEAIKKGAEIIIMQQLNCNFSTDCIIQVENTTKALGDIALYYRKKFSPIVVAITGSNGKTTTKEMIADILKQKYKIVKTPNSYNNDIGVPLTILQITDETEVLIVEMEMNEIGGTKRLCDIAKPQIGVITNIGDTHLEFMHSKQGVASEKSELLEAIAGNGIAVLNADDPMVMEIGKKFRFKQKIIFGIQNKSDIFANNVRNNGENGVSFLLCNNYAVQLQIPGVYNIYNALAAVGVARTTNCNYPEIISALQQFRLSAMRMEKIYIRGIEIINDAYNANPQSMLSSIETFVNFSAKGRKVVVLGDMLELGKCSKTLHKNLGKNLPPGIDILITVGGQAKYIAEGAKEKQKKIDIILNFDNPFQVVNKLVDIVKNGDKILIKGSRAVKMEEIITKLKEYYDCKTKIS